MPLVLSTLSAAPFVLTSIAARCNIDLYEGRGTTYLFTRIKAIRSALKLSQREFGERLGVSRDVISNIEYGRVLPKELLLHHICQLYGVKEQWLRTGEGDMFDCDPAEAGALEEAVGIFKTLRPEFQDYALEQMKKLAELQRRQ